ncbi:PEX5-related protein-like [Brevipalpus obovatus]|uniref:PEX5-related protein-like n=1 Tax=Brevipalpus obovatus TaxID=246614 RepID=UPI003D9F5579
MALRNLVNKECGGNNPMIDVAQQFTTNRLDPSWQQNESQNVSHQLELASGSSAFHMGSILQSLEQQSVASGSQQSHPLMQTTHSGPISAPQQAVQHQQQSLPLPNQSEMTYSRQPFNFQAAPMMPFTAPPPFALVHHQAPYMHGVPTVGPMTVPQEGVTKTPADFLDDFHKAEEAREKQDNLRESFDVTSFPQEAREFIEQAKNDKQISNSEFANFIEKIANGQIQVTDDGQLIVDMTESQKWAEEFATNDGKSSQNIETEQKIPAKPVETEKPTDYFPPHVAQNYEETYEFSKDNPYTEVDNPFEEGLKKLKAGDIPSAVLFFEAAVQKDSSEYLYWQYLGTTQAQNENDNQAIRALEECIKLKPDNLVGLMTMAASFANKNRGHEAAKYLSKWLNANPKYKFPVVDTESSIGAPKVLESVRDSFLQAARQQPNPPDADVQCGLGILFNCFGDFDKAVDCFRAALVVRPNEASLWNRLGASYANGDRPQEAIESYERALQISPGYLRCRANLGITCINQRKYDEAIVHFLTVLNIQNSGQGKSGQPTGKKNMSHHLWTNVRMVLGLSNKQSLYKCVSDRDLDSLNQHFGISPADLLRQSSGSSNTMEESS